MGFARGVCLVLATAAALAAPASAQAQAPAPAKAPAQAPAPVPAASATRMPNEMTLDAMLAARAYGPLIEALSHPTSADEVKAAMDWLRSNIQFGAPSVIAFLYARDLWVIGDQQKIDDPAKDVRIAAGLTALYTYDIMTLEGAGCEDTTAPPRHLAQMTAALHPALDYAASKPPDVRARLVSQALDLERRTEPFRKPDGLVCYEGDAQAKAAQAAGQPVPADGKAAPAPPGWKPAMVDPAVAASRQAKLRADMPAVLAKLITPPGAATTPPRRAAARR